MGGGGGKSKSTSQTDPVAAALAQQLFGLAQGELTDQRAFRDKFITPFLESLGLGDPETMNKLSPVFQAMFGQDVEQIGQSFGGQQTALIDSLASQGFRTGSQASGQTALAQGQAQATVDARRAATLNQLAALFQGANIATGNVGLFGTNLFGPSLGAFSPQQKSKSSQFNFSAFG
jgi:hypothetical protein